jgi:hypothetical protein
VSSEGTHPLYSRRESLGWLLAAGLRAGPTGQLGPAFHYQAVFSHESESWYTRFPILVTGDILTENQSRRLRANTTKLISYCWSPAFYPRDELSAALDWQAQVEKNRGAWLLNREPLGGGSAAAGRTADWYDFGNTELVSARVRHMAGRLAASGYDGYFFDTLGSEHVPEPVRNEFRTRHPALDYDMAQGRFLQELRGCLPFGKVIFTNQGYRHPEAFLAASDLDLSESYFTATNPRGSTTFRKWCNPQAPWDSVKVPMEKLIVPAAQSSPRVRFVHLNYAAGDRTTIARAISYSYACGKLFNHDAYLVAPNSPADERDEIYFTDLGKPTSPTYREARDEGVAWREYQKGIVAINSGRETAVAGPERLKLTDPPRGYVFR